MWIIFASLLLVSARANRYDQGPQKFYDVSIDSETSEQNENKEVIVYLTPEQVKALEDGGAVVQPTEENEEDDEQQNPELPVPPVTEDQEENEQSQDEDAQQEEEAQPEEQSPEDDLSQDIDFEAILRLLNDEQIEEEETVEQQARNEPQIQEQTTETPRTFSPRVTLAPQQPQNEQKNVAPAAAQREQILKTYSYIRYQPNEQPQRINIQLLRGENEPISAQESTQELEAPPAPAQERRKYKLVPVEAEQTSETPIQEENVQQQISEAEEAAPAPSKNKLLQDELLSILRELKASPKFNNQKYAIEIERLRNLENERAAEQAAKESAEKAAEIAKTAPLLIQQQLNKKRLLNKNKQSKAPAAEPKQAKAQQPKAQKTSALENQNPIPFPVLNVENSGSRNPIPVPVEIPKVLSVKNVYVKTRTDKPYIVSRRVPENKQQNPLETSKGKPERITILRHIWEQ